MPRTLVFIAPTFPHPVATFLAEHGYAIVEAQSADQALSFSQAENVDAVIIAHGQDWPGLAELRQRSISLNLEIHATGPDVFFELSHILPTATPKKPH